MNEDDRIVSDFFAEMKARDIRKVKPLANPFTKKPIKYPWLEMAAVFCLLSLSLLFYSIRTEKAEQEEIVVVVQEPKSRTASLMQVEQTIESWQSPTQSLIDEF